MRYSDGVEVRIGDRIQLYDMDAGVVVFSIDTDEYSAEFPKDDWAYLGVGVMVRTDRGVLVHLDGADPDPRCLTRLPTDPRLGGA